MSEAGIPLTASNLADISPRIANDVRVSAKSLFGSPVWDFSEECRTPNRTIGVARLRWNFKRSAIIDLDHPQHLNFKTTLREFLYYRTSGVAPGRSLVLATTAIVETRLLRQLCAWLCRRDCFSFGDVEQHHLDSYLSHLKQDKKMRANSIVSIVNAIKLLAMYGDNLSDPLQLVPWGGRSAVAVAGATTSGMNATRIIPDEIFEPLYRFALGVVDSGAHERVAFAWKDSTSPSHSQIAMTRAELQRVRKVRNSILQRHGFKNVRQLESVSNEIVASCFIVIAALSGMRDSEIKSLKCDCALVERNVDGSVRFFKLIGEAIKNRRAALNSEGEARTWTVIEPVHRAVEVLAVIRRHDPRSHDDFLFTRLRDNQVINLELQRIVKKLGGAGNAPWHLTTAQFRRTLARWIVRRPFGLIAGKLQFGHISVATTQGYAAYDKPWVREVEAERIAFNQDILEEVAVDIANNAVIGPRSKELLEFRGRSGDRRIDDIAWMLKNSAIIGKSLHVGQFNYCFFDPDKALCKKTDEDCHKPRLTFCQPDHCANSCITRRHLPLWRAQIAEAEGMRRRKGISRFQDEALRLDIEKMTSLISPLESGEFDEPG